MTTNLRVSVEQAAQTALQVYLQAEMDAQYSGGPERCIVSDSWPEPDSGLPRRAVSIIPAGPRDDMYVQEQDIRREDLAGPDSNPKLYTWRVAACRQPIQLDIWSTYASHRDDLLARLQDSLRKGQGHTLGIPNSMPVRDGVLLALDPASGFRGFADYTFDGPSKTDTARSPRVREYRASIMGFIDVDLTVKAPSARLARVLLQFALGSTTPGQASPPPDFTIALNTETGATAVTAT